MGVVNEWDQISKVLARLDKIERITEQHWRRLEFQAMAEGLSDGEESEGVTEKETWAARLSPKQQQLVERRGSITDLLRHHTNQSQIARMLGVRRSVVAKDIKRYHLAER